MSRWGFPSRKDLREENERALETMADVGQKRFIEAERRRSLARTPVAIAVSIEPVEPANSDVADALLAAAHFSDTMDVVLHT